MAITIVLQFVVVLAAIWIAARERNFALLACLRSRTEACE